MSRESFVTLATDDAYGIGALVLGNSLKQTKTTKELTIIVGEGVSSSMTGLMEVVFDNVIAMTSLVDFHRAQLCPAYMKLYCWCLSNFSKAVFLDSDIVVLQNIDELFEREELSAAVDARWPDCFNTGVFVYRPSQETFNQLHHFSITTGSFDGTIHGLLNTYFADWTSKGMSYRLPFIYNCVCSIPDQTNYDFYTRVSAWVRFGGSAKVVHFSGPVKPWHCVSAAAHCASTAHAMLTDDSRRTVSQTTGMLAYWWSLFLVTVRPKLSVDMPGIVGQLASVGPRYCNRHHDTYAHEIERMYAWERGEVDYTGKDRFANILSKICTTIRSVGGTENTLFGFDV